MPGFVHGQPLRKIGRETDIVLRVPIDGLLKVQKINGHTYGLLQQSEQCLPSPWKRSCCGYTWSMLEITPTLQIDERELHFDFIRSAGPGGQNVNKVATAVQLRFAISTSTLPEDVKARLTRLAHKRVTQKGVLIIEAKRFRTQEQNREAAIRRFIQLVRKAAEKPKQRKQTRPSRASKQERLDAKKKRGEVKKGRQNKSFDPVT